MEKENRLYSISLGVASLQGGLVGVATALSPATCRPFQVFSPSFFVGLGLIVTIDNLEVGQFIYLLLNNQKIRQVIDTITSKVVVILGRFTGERKRVLDAIREELRKHDYIPVLFDFEKRASKDITGTVETRARMARF